MPSIEKTHRSKGMWEELLMKHETCWARVISDSMYPAIRRGDQVLEERAPLDKARFGDIIVFRRNRTATLPVEIGN